MKRKKNYTIDLSERGKYDIRNKLNDLTGKEWVYNLSSVEEIISSSDDIKLLEYMQQLIITRYSTKGKDSFSYDLRKEHPTPKPPPLMKKLIEFFTKKDQWILDPFAGVGGTLLGASLSGRNAVGIELEPKYIDIYKKVCEKESLKKQIIIEGDSRNIEYLIKEKSPVKEFDLILTDPPYGNMMAKPKTGELSKKKKNTDPTPFTKSDKDIGNLPLDKFLNELKYILSKSAIFLKKKGYLLVFCKDFQPNKNYHGLLHADIVKTILEIEKLSFKGYKIWVDKTINLFPYGYPYSYVGNQLHQFILIFRKEG